MTYSHVSDQIIGHDSFIVIQGCISVWAGFSERTRDGNKFIVAERPVNQARRNYCAETADSIIEERKLKKENAANGFFDASGKDDSSPSNLLDVLFDE